MYPEHLQAPHYQGGVPEDGFVLHTNAEADKKYFPDNVDFPATIPTPKDRVEAYGGYIGNQIGDCDSTDYKNHGTENNQNKARYEDATRSTAKYGGGDASR